MRNPDAAVNADDRTIPTEYVGKIGSNYYCRGWNAKRTKYCGARAGCGTQHAGVGRCAKHGGKREYIRPPTRPLGEYLPPTLRKSISHGLRQLLERRLPDPALAAALRDEILALRVHDSIANHSDESASS